MDDLVILFLGKRTAINLWAEMKLPTIAAGRRLPAQPGARWRHAPLVGTVRHHEAAQPLVLPGCPFALPLPSHEIAIEIQGAYK